MMLTILKKKHLTFKQRLSLLAAFLQVRCIRFAIGRFISEDSVTHISVLGYTIWINTFSDFYWTFVEVFVNGEYYFTSEDTSPHVIDLGGHIGITTLYFKWLYPDASITVFEPLPENADILEKNIYTNKLKRVKLERVAVTGKYGKLYFTGSGRSGHVLPERKKDTDDIEVNTVPLSEYIREPVDFCKMDIEGSEQSVLRELQDSHKLNSIHHLVMEYHSMYRNNKLSDIIKFLEDSKFSISFKTNIKSDDMKKRDFTHIMLIARIR